MSRMHINSQKMLTKFGLVVREVVIGDKVIVHVFDPSDIEIVFRHEGRYPLRLSHQALLKYRMERPETYKSSGLFPTNGKEWHRLRSTFQKPLLQTDNLKFKIKPLDEVTEDLLKKVYNIKDKNGEVKDFQQELYKWALECTGVLTLNKRLGCLARELSQDSEPYKLIKAAAETHQSVMVTEYGFPLWRFFPTSPYRRLVAAQDYMAKTIQKYLEEAVRQKNNLKDDFRQQTILTKFLALPGVDIKDIFTMILDIFLAGIDTTAYASAFVLYNLAQNQHVQELLRKEMFDVLPNTQSQLTSSALSSMSYLKATIKESLRLNPVAIGVGRVLPEDIVLSGYRIPAGTMVILHNQVACRHKKHFRDPLKFIPERWLKNSPSFEKPHPFLLLPFGYGPRMCLGRRIAELQLYILISKIIRNFRVEYHHGTIDCFTRLINVPDKPLKLKFLEID
ncbi:cytochrome P450 302a1, mitochondrial-like isoform X2 [Tachypleus tridentatus]